MARAITPIMTKQLYYGAAVSCVLGLGLGAWLRPPTPPMLHPGATPAVPSELTQQPDGSYSVPLTGLQILDSQAAPVAATVSATPVSTADPQGAPDPADPVDNAVWTRPTPEAAQPPTPAAWQPVPQRQAAAEALPEARRPAWREPQWPSERGDIVGPRDDPGDDWYEAPRPPQPPGPPDRWESRPDSLAIPPGDDDDGG